MSAVLETSQEEFELAHAIADAGRARMVEIPRSALLHLLIDHSRMLAASGGRFSAAVDGRQDVVNTEEKQDARRKVAVKYRDNAGNEWSGRGMTPTWLRAYEDSGRNRDEFLVSANGSDTGE